MSEGIRDFDICLHLSISPTVLQRAQAKIRERAAIETNDAGRLYERALRLNSEAERAAIESRFGALMEMCPQAVLVVEGRSGLIRQANNQASQLFGYTREELVGMKVESLVPTEQQEIHHAYRAGFLASVRKREMGYHPPIFALRQNGSTIEIAIALTATPTNDDVMVVCTQFEKGILPKTHAPELLSTE